VFDEVLGLLATRPGGETAIHLSAPERAEVSRDRLVNDVRAVAAGGTAAPAGSSTWVQVRDPYLHVVAALGSLCHGSVALIEPVGPAAAFDRLAALCWPAQVVADAADAEVVRWARERGHPVRIVDRTPAGRLNGAGPRGVADARLQFFSSGTTGEPKCLGVGGAQLVAAVRGVGARLALGPADVSLSVAQLNHTLGLVTTVLVGLAAGGSVAFADPTRARDVAATIDAVGPTWCAATPSTHRLLRRIARGAGLDWPALRLLRSSAAPLPDDLAAELEEHFGVPVLNAYAMTEAPGEVASQSLADERVPGTVGRPTLCEVEIRSHGAALPAGASGEVWVRGPNVVPRDLSAAPGSWQATGDVGVLDETGLLRLTGRTADVINKGGLKVWPPDVEAAALRHPHVRAAVAFPIPHRGLGETIGLAVVPRDGQAVDGSAVRRLLRDELPRDQWPSSVVVWDRVPVTPRGKVDRRGLWRHVVDAPGAGGPLGGGTRTDAS
jgi:acyl-CoA synthetase (AMP-forming)/AMP-acid ligase II